MYIEIGNNQPGMAGLFAFSPETSVPLKMLAEVLLRSDFSNINPGDRELLGAFVSEQNNCNYCFQLHKAIAALYLGEELVEEILTRRNFGRLHPRMSNSFYLSSMVAAKSYGLRLADIESVKKEGMSDKDIHDVVLITSAFSMYNRYLSMLGMDNPKLTDGDYRELALRIFTTGYNSQ